MLSLAFREAILDGSIPTNDVGKIARTLLERFCLRIFLRIAVQQNPGGASSLLAARVL
jgi:hypothetical protein